MNIQVKLTGPARDIREATERKLDENQSFRPTPEAGPELNQTAGEIRLAYNLTDSPLNTKGKHHGYPLVR